MKQWKVAVLTPRKVEKLKDTSDFYPASVWSGSPQFPQALLDGEVGWYCPTPEEPGWRVIRYDRVAFEVSKKLTVELL